VRILNLLDDFLRQPHLALPPFGLFLFNDKDVGAWISLLEQFENVGSVGNIRIPPVEMGLVAFWGYAWVMDDGHYPVSVVFCIHHNISFLTEPLLGIRYAFILLRLAFYRLQNHLPRLSCNNNETGTFPYKLLFPPSVTS
jgi:hypothetical protein